MSNLVEDCRLLYEMRQMNKNFEDILIKSAIEETDKDILESLKDNRED